MMASVSKRRKLSNGDAVPVLSPDKSNDDAETTTQTPAIDTQDQRRSLFVRSLPASVTTERLTEHFSQSYPLKHATVVLDKATGISRGFGFVTFTDAEDARNALNEFNNSVIDKRKIKVELAESRSREVAEDLATGRTKGSVNVKGEELRAERQKQQEDNRPPKLIVRNLPWSVKTSDDLAKLFLSYGKVKHAVVPKLAQKGTGGAQPQAGFGIVILRGKKNAEKALVGINGKEIDGRVLAVDWAVDRETWEKVKEIQRDTEKDDDNVAGGSGAGKQVESSQADADATSPEGSGDDMDAGIDEDEGVAVSNEDEDEAEDMDMEDPDLDHSLGESPSAAKKPDSNDTTVFIRNLPYTADDDSIYEHFRTEFGPVRYARAVYDPETERPRGTAFVSFYSEDVARECVKNAPKHEAPPASKDKGDKKRKGESLTHSLLQNESSDPSGKYTLEGRVLQVTRALAKPDADRRAEESSQKRSENKRRLYLLSEGTIPKGSQLYDLLGKAEIDVRESSSRQRQKLVKQNPNLGLSLTRLSVRNVPRSLSSKELKALAREAVVGFAKDVKDGKRQSLNKEELTRGGEEDKEAERLRKKKGVGIVKQVKIVFESENTGGKVGEGKGGRSRGYGFIEYYGHRHALMGLRWLNGHLVQVTGGDGAEKNKRLIVEFAIENAQVVQRRTEREQRVREGGFERRPRPTGSERRSKDDMGKKRKRNDDDHQGSRRNPTKGVEEKKRPKKAESAAKDTASQDEKNKVAARNRIIAQKRQRRKSRKG